MGLSPSKRVTHTLSTSSAFTSACDSAYDETLTLSQHAFPGVPPYQLASSATRLHHALSSLPLFSLYLPSPPSTSQVDATYKSILRRRRRDGEPCLGREEFREFALELFAGAILESAGKALMLRVPVGVAGIVGVGAVAKTGRDLVGAAVGVYALGVAASVYLSLA